jgi:enoyl-CoA hydratase/carnithine racemase
MLALACDYRLMVSGKAKIGLNEITFGSSVFAGSAEMLKFLVGGKNAHAVLYEGGMYLADAAADLGLVDQVSSGENLMEDARAVALRMAARDATALRSLKGLLRGPVAEEMTRRERQSIQEFVEIWYSESTWRNLQAITIHS